MPTSSSNQDQSLADKDSKLLSLSSALLAPVNSIFEAQIHAARAFLNFIFQMGFRHQAGEKEKEEWNANPEKYTDELEELKARENAKLKINALNEKRKGGSELTDEEVEELKRLLVEHGDLYQQSFDFMDNSGNMFSVNVPNLALLPIRPLAIQEAEFSYNFMVKNSETKNYEQNPTRKLLKKTTEKDEPTKSPWFLIKEPKSIQGHFVEKGEEERSSAAAIKVNIKIGNTEMPYGLEKLIVHLTNSVDILNKDEQNL